MDVLTSGGPTSYAEQWLELKLGASLLLTSLYSAHNGVFESFGTKLLHAGEFFWVMHLKYTLSMSLSMMFIAPDRGSHESITCYSILQMVILNAPYLGISNLNR